MNPPLVNVVWLLVQKDRSPWFAASMAAMTNPLAARESAAVKRSARPLARSCRKMTRGEHFPNGISEPTQSGALASCGVTISTLMVSATAVPALLNAPLAGSRRLKVVIFVSSTSRMFELGVAGATPVVFQTRSQAPVASQAKITKKRVWFVTSGRWPFVSDWSSSSTRVALLSSFGPSVTALATTS